MDIEHVCSRVLHPITGETITKSKQLYGDPATQKLWKRAMNLELGRLSQGFLHKKGMNKVTFMNQQQIIHIPKYITVTYARIVVYYFPQKSYPNRVRILAGGNLID